MNAVRENVEEFVVVLRMDDASSYEKVNRIIEPLLEDEHIDLLNPELLDFGPVGEPTINNQKLDITDEQTIERLVAASPPEKRAAVQEAITLLRQLDESITHIADGQGQILNALKESKASAVRIRAKVAAARRRSKDTLANLGF